MEGQYSSVTTGVRGQRVRVSTGIGQWRSGRINLKLLLILVVVLGVGATIGAVAYKTRKNLAAGRARSAAQAALAKQDWAEACKQLKKCLEYDPGDMEMLPKYAEANLAVRPRQPENLSYAIAAYRLMLRERPGDEVVSDKLAALYLGIGDFGSCKHVAEQRLRYAPADGKAVLWLGKALMAQRKGEEAREILRTFVEQHPEQVEAYALLCRLAMVDMSATSIAAGLEWMNRAVERNPHSADALSRRAQFHLRSRKDPPSARADLELADQFQSPNPNVRMLLAECWLELAEHDRAQAEIQAIEQMTPAALASYDIDVDDLKFVRLKAEAILAIRRDSGEAGLEIAERGLRELVGDRRVKFCPFAAELYWGAGRLEDARRCVEQYRSGVGDAAKQDRSIGERVALLQAAVEVYENKPYEAINTLEELALSKPLYPHVWKVLSRAYLMTGQSRRALSALEMYCNSMTKDRQALMELARGYMVVGIYNKALHFAAEAERLDPTDVAARLLRMEATLHRDTAMSDSETRRLTDELELMRTKNPADVRVRLLLASMASMRGRLEDAISELQQALVLNPSSLQASGLLAEVYMRNSQRDLAIEVWRSAIEHSPDKAAPRIALAQLLVTPLAASRPASGDKPVSTSVARAVAASSRPSASTRPSGDTAEEVLRDAVADLTGDERALASVALGRLLLMQNHRAEAIELLREVAKQVSRNVDVRLMLLELPDIQKDRAEASRLVEEVKKIEGERGVRWQFEQAKMMLSESSWKERQEEIERLLNRCIASDPGWALPVTVLGRMYERLGRDDKAEEVYRQHTESSPGSVLVASSLLELLERQHRYTESARVLERVSGELPLLSAHRAKIAIGQANYSKAIDELERRLAVDPDDAASHVLLARLIYTQNHDVVAAMAHLAEATRIAPDMLAITATRVAILAGEGRHEEAVKMLDLQVEQRRDFPSYLMRAEYNIQAKNFDEAERDYIELSKFKDLQAAGCEALARFYEVRNRWDDVVATCQRGLEADPNSLSLKRVLIRVLVLSPNLERRQQGRKMLDDMLAALPNDANLLCMKAGVLLREGTLVSCEEAVDILERVVQLNPGMLLAHRYLIDIARGRGELGRASQFAARALGSNPRNIELLMIRADLENELRNVVSARELAQSVLDIDNRSIPARGLLVRIALQAGDVKTADSLNAEAIRIDPHNEEVWIARAEILNVQGRTTEAIQRLEAFAEKEPGRALVTTWLALTDLYRINGNLVKAEEMLKKAEANATDTLPVLLVRLKLLAAKKQFDALIDELTQYCKRNPQQSQALVSSASILASSNGREYLNKLKPLFDQFIAANPDRMDGYLGLAMVSTEMKEPDEAEQAYRRLLEVAPYHQQGLNNLAWILGVDMGRPEDGLAFANKGILRYPDDVHLLNTRGVLYYQMGLYVEAEKDLKKCMSVAAKVPETLARTSLYLGRVYARQGMHKEARSAYSRAIEVDKKGTILTPEERAESEQMSKIAS